MVSRWRIARFSDKMAHAYKNKYDGYVAGSQFRERAGRMGVFNMGRNVVMKAVVPLVFETKK